MTNTEKTSDKLPVAAWVVIAALVAAVPPIWPIGFYTLLRLVVCAFVIYALVARPKLRGGGLGVALGFVALLFNPIFPVYLDKALWVPIDLGVAYFFWWLFRTHALDTAEERPG